MPSSKLNRIAIYVSATLIILLVIFALLRNRADDVTLHQANVMLKNHTVKKVLVSKEYVYLKTDDNFIE